MLLKDFIQNWGILVMTDSIKDLSYNLIHFIIINLAYLYIIVNSAKAMCVFIDICIQFLLK